MEGDVATLYMNSHFPILGRGSDRHPATRTEEDSDMDPRLQPATAILKLNWALFRRALDGVDQAAAERRPNDHTNSLAFIACHVLGARFYLMKLAGHERTNPWQALFDAASDVTTMKEYPPLYELLAEWDELHEATLERLRTCRPWTSTPSQRPASRRRTVRCSAASPSSPSTRRTTSDRWDSSGNTSDSAPSWSAKAFPAHLLADPGPCMTLDREP